MPGGGLVFNPSGQIGGIDYEILNDGATKRNAVGQGPSRTVIYMVDYEESDDFMDTLMGSVTTTSVGSGGGVYLFQPGHRYPNNTNLVCVSVDCEGLGLPKPDPKLIKYDWARVTALYETPRYTLDNPEMSYPEIETAIGGLAYNVTKRSSVAAETIPESGLKHEETAPNDVNPSKKVKVEYIKTEITLTIFGVPFMPRGISDSLAGMVNDSPIFGFARGTVKYNGQECQPDTNPDGSHSYTVRRDFEAQDHDWNAQWHPVAGVGWSKVKSGSVYAYPYANLLTVLQP